MSVVSTNTTSGSLPTVLLQHWEELQGLWQMRSTAIMDSEYVASDISALDARIEAHVDGLLVGGEASIPVLQEGLEGEGAAVAAAAYVLLRLKDKQAAELVVEAMHKAEAGQLEALGLALRQSNLSLITDQLAAMYEQGPALLAAAAAEAFADHGRLSKDAGRLKEFFGDEDPEVRKAAWRITALVDANGGSR